MLYKRAFFILFLIIMVIGTISSISANDLTGDMINDTSDVLNEVDSGFKFQEIQDNDVVESSDDGTFTSLQNKINNAAEDSTITLENDYYYNANFANKKGIQVTKSLTINGNGHAIDGLSKSGLILIKDAKRVILNNITFRNGVYNNDDEQTVVGIHNVEYIELNACSFTNNEGTIGGAVKIRDVNSSLISDSIFSNNVASNNGGAIHLGAINESTIAGCKFINNEVVDYGGAICLNEIVTSLIVDCSFNNNIVMEGRAGAIFLWDMGNSTFKNCSFTNNNANEDSGGAVASIGADTCSFIGCSFENNEVYGAGGDVNFVSVNYTAFNHCKFKHSVARNYAGGSAYLQEFGYCEFNDCNFSFAFATYSGLIHSEVGNLYLKNINVEDSYSRTFGGVVSSRYSNLTVEDCNFKNYHAMDDAGGAIYSFKGNLDVINSSFFNGSAKYGGAISSVESNLKVLSSKFICNQAISYGGAIYHIYGKIHVDGSFFNTSHASSGSAIKCEMSDSLIFTNNIFLNSTAEFGSSIALVCCNDNVVESGNHFEDVYHLILFYLGHDEKPVAGVKVLNYVLSNTGYYLNTYDSNFLDRLGIADADGRYDDLFTLNLWDSNFPINSTIFGDYSGKFLSNYNLTKYYTFNGESEYFDKLYFYIMNDANYPLEEYSEDASPKMINGTFEFSLKDWMFYRAYHLNPDIGTSIYPISLFDSSTSISKDIPQAYDSRNYGYVTPVEDQGDAGNCWAFAGIATLETCIKKITGLTYDFSENNVKNLMAMYSLLGMHLNTNNGGYDSMAMAYLNSWLGPINDTYEPYNGYSTLSTTYHPLMHIQNIYFLPARENSLDNDAYKKAIMDYGAVSVTFNWAGSGLHAVSLVGWDDNYYGYDSLGTYTRGAWIFKNSWGPDWGNNGFGYLSYRNAFTSDSRDYCHAYTFIFNKNDDYNKNYQYDDAGVSDYICYDGSVYYSNKFISTEDVEDLRAFSTYFKHPTNYKVSVYVNGTFILSQNGYSDAGYYTIPFNEKITLHRGDEFTIMVENHNSGENLFPVCQAKEVNMVNFNPNTSFVSYDGRNWFDLYNLQNYADFLYGGIKSNTCQVACIKAFTSIQNLSNTIRIDIDKFESVNLNEKIKITVSLKREDIINKLNHLDNHVFTLNINGKNYYALINDAKASFEISFDNAGDYVLSAQYKDNIFISNTVKFNFKVNKKNSLLYVGSLSKVYGGSENALVTLKDDSGNAISNAEITFNLNGKSIKVRTNSNGQVSIPVDAAPKTYTATVTFAGGGNYNGASAKINIVVKKTSSKITAKKATIKVKKTKKYTIVLKDTYGKAIKKVNVVLKVKGKTFKTKTANNGKATFKLKLPKKGSFKATIKFSGNAYYNSVTKKVKITVKK